MTLKSNDMTQTNAETREKLGVTEDPAKKTRFDQTVGATAENGNFQIQRVTYSDENIKQVQGSTLYPNVFATEDQAREFAAGLPITKHDTVNLVQRLDQNSEDVVVVKNDFLEQHSNGVHRGKLSYHELRGETAPPPSVKQISKDDVPMAADEGIRAAQAKAQKEKEEIAQREAGRSASGAVNADGTVDASKDPAKKADGKKDKSDDKSKS